MDTGAVQGGRAGPMESADAQLRARLERGDEAACEELWRVHAAALQRFAEARLGGHSELAEDVMVQTLAAAFRSIRSFDPRRASLRTWLYGVARRTIQGELRTQQRRRSVPRSAQVSADEGSAIAAGGDLAAEATARLEARRKVALLASALSDGQMEVLVLHFVVGLSLKEIAEVVHRSPRAVHSLLHRAKQKARERLAEDGE